MEKLKLDRVSCHVTTKCNLRCKMCSAYIPELYENEKSGGGRVVDYALDDIKQSFKVYFDMVEYVRMISLSGGEPFMSPTLDSLVSYLLTFDKQFSKLEIFTNGSIPISDRLVKVCVGSKKVHIFIDHYGPEVSKEVNSIVPKLEQEGILYQVRKYYGEDMHMGGWHDYCVTGIKADEKEAEMRFEKCYSGKNGVMLATIFGTHLYLCPISKIGERIGRIPQSDTLNIDLCDDSTTVEEKLVKLCDMNSVDYNPACAYCNGMGVYENEPRFKPGEQICTKKGILTDATISEKTYVTTD